MEDQQQLAPCPFCGASAYVASETDYDNIRWHYVRCRGCGTRSRGKWHSPGNDCPQFYAEVREEWNRRASPSSSVLERARESLRELVTLEADGMQAGESAIEAWERARSALAEIDRALGGGNGK